MRGTVGSCLPSHNIRLEGVPEMKYDPLSDPPRGEVCIQGPVVFSGYYKASFAHISAVARCTLAKNDRRQ